MVSDIEMVTTPGDRYRKLDIKGKKKKKRTTRQP